MKCENCSKEHDGSFASGRFCSKKCSRSFSTKNMKPSTKILNCSVCNKPSIASKKARKNDFKCDDCKLYTKSCEKCKKEFKTTRKNQKFCSINCSCRVSLDKGRESQKSLDWSAINKKSYREGKNYVAGGTTEWFDYKDIRVQGSYELRACFIFDKMKSLNLIKDWEYTNDRIPYVDVDGSNRTYLLDFKVINHDNTFYYVETKGYSTETDECKWKSVREKGIKLDVWFQEDLVKIEKELNV